MSKGKDDSAVSTVMAAMMVIVITVLIAGTVWVMINKVKPSINEDKRPTLIFSVTGTDAKVTKVDSGLDWVKDLRYSGTCSPTLNGGAFPSAAGTFVQPGDIVGCNSGQTLTISSSPEKANVVLFRHTF